MVTKSLIFPSPGCWPIRSGAYKADRLRRYAVIDDVKGTVRFPPRFGDAWVADDVVDGQEELIEAWASAFDAVQETPDGYWVDDVEGEIPSELEGTYYRNGPGAFNFINEPVAAPLDANGIIGSVAIKDGRAFFRSRFVKTKESLLEERAGKRLFRGVFGTIPKHGVAPFRLMQTRNAANGKPILANDKIYAPYEGCVASELDARTLETLYPTLRNGLLTAVLTVVLELFTFVARIFRSLWMKLRPWSPILDPRIEKGFGDSQYDGHMNRLIAHTYNRIFSWKTKSWTTNIKIFEIGDDFRVHTQKSYTMDRIGMVHSIGITNNYYVVNLFPFTVDPKKIVDSELGIIHSIIWDSEGSKEFHLIPRHPTSQEKGNGAVLKFKLHEATCIFHFVNAFEDGDDVIIDALHYPTNPYFGFRNKSDNDYRYVRSPGAVMKRTVFSAKGDVETRTLSDRQVELPCVHPSYVGRNYRYAYMLTGRHPRGLSHPVAIAKMDLETGGMQMWTKGIYCIAGEPLFVPRPGGYEEDDGWVMAFVYNGLSKKTEFVVLDAKNVDKGPLATLYLRDTIGHGFHGIWSERYYGPLSCAEKLEASLLN